MLPNKAESCQRAYLSAQAYAHNAHLFLLQQVYLVCRHAKVGVVLEKGLGALMRVPRRHDGQLQGLGSLGGLLQDQDGLYVHLHI